MATTFTNNEFTHAEQALLVMWALEFEYPGNGYRDHRCDAHQVRLLHDMGVIGRLWWLSSKRGWHLKLDVSADDVTIRLEHGEADWVRRDLAEFKLRSE
jgi:hypothetical protein